MSASLIGRLGSSVFRLSTTAVSMSLTGSRFSSESAPRPFQHGIRGRGGTIFGSALPSEPIREVLIQHQGFALVNRRNMMRIIARQMKAATVLA
jgi:hypothetical protein